MLSEISKLSLKNLFYHMHTRNTKNDKNCHTEFQQCTIYSNWTTVVQQLQDVEQVLKSYIQYSSPFLHYGHPLRLRNPGLFLTFLLFEVIYFYLSSLRQLFHFTDRCYVTLKLILGFFHFMRAVFLYTFSFQLLSSYINDELFKTILL